MDTKNAAQLQCITISLSIEAWVNALKNAFSNLMIETVIRIYNLCYMHFAIVRV